ncbi:rhox homeobox family member 1 [Aotus nancymaae]|uniref:rhox homeobox family member 1 n=1 Tax=Aotus nancymaae TaxID=37293 RepID=UPI0030FEB863
MAHLRIYDTKFYYLNIYQREEIPILELGAASRAEDHGGQGAPGLMGNMNPEGDGGVNPEGGVNRDGGVIHKGGGGNQEPVQQQQRREEPAQAAMEDPQPEDWEPRIRRKRFTRLQVQELESVFEFTQYPDVPTRRELADAIGVPENKVRVWFKNKRARCRRQQRQLMPAIEPPPKSPSDSDDGFSIILN